VTEVLSGDYYQPLSTSSPHQIWSAAMVISPLLRGLLGLSFDATAKRLVFDPHIPADWPSLVIGKLRIGPATVNLAFSKTENEIRLNAYADANCELEFSPALSPRARVISAELNSHRVPVHIETNDSDQHATVHVPLVPGMNAIRIRVYNDFMISYSNSLPSLGNAGRGLRVLSESWAGPRAKPDLLTLEIAGVPGSTYELAGWGLSQIYAAEGAEQRNGRLVVHMPFTNEHDYVNTRIVIHFSGKSEMHEPKQRTSDGHRS